MFLCVSYPNHKNIVQKSLLIGHNLSKINCTQVPILRFPARTGFVHQLEENQVILLYAVRKPAALC